MQRDLERIAHAISAAENPCDIPKTIIFSQTKEDVYSVFSFLSALAVHKHSVAMYHASQSEGTKVFIQSAFRSSLTELRCLSATIAFGMVRMNVYARDADGMYVYIFLLMTIGDGYT